MAIVAPILILLLFGTMEMGLLFKDSLSLNSACREAARVAAVGATTSDIAARARAAATTLNPANVTVTSQYRTYSGGVWSAWTALGDNAAGTANSAPSGAQVKITLTYPHQLVTGALFASLATPGTNKVTIRGSMVMMRE
jgi:Flp pilus assembly protein TadG